MKLLYKVIIVFLSFAPALSFAQSRTIKGKVTDDKGKALSGASIVEKGVPENGATTDLNGNFKLNLKGESKLVVISYGGYLSKEIPATDNMAVALQPDVKGLEDVIVVGYGKQKKITKTGAVSSISGNEIRQTPAASLQNTLVGKLPGFTSQLRSGRPGDDGAQFFVRGISTFNGSGQPLILVDDVEYSYSQFSRIDANEVESITVLKDASTTAIYGIKGANGVVLVTTRRGKAGKPKVNVSNQFAITSPTKVYEYLDAYQSASLRNEAAQNDFGKPILLPADSLSYRLFSQSDLDHFKNGDDPYGHPNVDWYNTIFKKSSLMNTTSLDVSGGSDRVKYFISGGYLWQNGMLRSFPTSDNFNNNYYYKRYNFRSNLDLKATDRLRFAVNLAGSSGETNRPVINTPNVLNDPFFEIAGFGYLPPFAYPVYNPNGTYGYNSTFIQGNNNLIGRIANTGYSRDFENIMNLNVNGTYDLSQVTKGLSVKGTLAYSTSNTANRTLSRSDNFPAYNYNPVTNTYTIRDPLATRMPLLGLTTTNGATGVGAPVRKLNLQSAVNYTRKFGNHNVSALALFNQTTSVATSTDVTLNNLPSKFRGYTFRVGYDFKQKYLLELNGAYNGTDRFQSAKRYGFFPAVSVGWNVAEEKFMKKVSWVDLFKLRGSWGVVGSDDIGTYRYIYQQIYTQTTGSYNFGESPNSFNGIFEGQIGNTDVRWEKERKIDIGTDFSFFKGKINGTVDVFDNYRYDILTTRNRIPIIFGQTLPVVNVGEVSNKGYEIELNYRNRVGKVDYSVKGTYSVAKNKVLNYDDPEPLYPWKSRTGLPIGLVANGLYQFNGFYQDSADIANSPKPPGGLLIRPGFIKYKDLNGDGVINQDDRAYSGLPNLPQTIFGFGGSVTYKGFSVNFLFQGAKDYDFRMMAEAIDAFTANMQPVHARRWQPGDGNSADYPALTLNPSGVNSARDYPSTYWSVRSWYVRLRSAELSYSFPASVINHFNMDGLRVFVNGANLLTFSNITSRYNYDPETTTGSTGSGMYPQQKIINFGLTLSFK